MSYVDEFLDLTSQLPRKIIRNLKLLRTVEEKEKELHQVCKKSREVHLQKLKDNSLKNNEQSSLQSIESIHKNLLNLSDYKKEILQDIKYIVQNSFLDKLQKIKEEGQKEANNNIDLKGDKILLEENKLEEIDSKTNITTLGIKKGRGKTNRIKSNVAVVNEQGENKNYCICKKISSDEMIQCDNPKCKNGEWFHFKCCNIDKNKIPDEWFCSPECRNEMNKKTKNKKKKLQK